jgi:hypothetical protein
MPPPSPQTLWYWDKLNCFPAELSTLRKIMTSVYLRSFANTWLRFSLQCLSSPSDFLYSAFQAPQNFFTVPFKSLFVARDAETLFLDFLLLIFFTDIWQRWVFVCVSPPLVASDLFTELCVLSSDGAAKSLNSLWYFLWSPTNCIKRHL